MVIRHPSFPLRVAARKASSPVVAAPRVPRTGTLASRFDAAMQFLEQGRWSQAFDELSGLANAGHPPAARIAGMQVQRGASLFGGSFIATREEQMRWRRIGD